MSHKAPFAIPSEDAIAHSMALIEYIIAAIESHQGCLSFRNYMNMALYQPGLGYYVAGSHKIGMQGDFITAPEVSPLFGQCIAHACQISYPNLSEQILFELGAGSGALCVSILQALQQSGNLPKQYWILEPSPDLQARQRDKISRTIPECLDQVCWLNTLPTQPFEGIILANEILDALPVHRFCVNHAGIQMLGVSYDGQRFQWQTRQSVQPEFEHAVTALQQTVGKNWHLPYTSEINLALPAWLEAITGMLSNGKVILIDYGYEQPEYYHSQRNQGTLMCHYRHQAHSDPFMYPGLQDITAHVDFTKVAHCAESLNLTVESYQSQAHFLLDNQLAQYANTTEKAQQMRWLTHPNHFGEVFKVMILNKCTKTKKA